jgi:hypothetical protein
MLITVFNFIPKATRGFEPISYRGALLSTLLHATVYMFLHSLLNVLVQIANKTGLQKIKQNFNVFTSVYKLTIIKFHDSVLSSSQMFNSNRWAGRPMEKFCKSTLKTLNWQLNMWTCNFNFGSTLMAYVHVYKLKTWSPGGRQIILCGRTRRPRYSLTAHAGRLEVIIAGLLGCRLVRVVAGSEFLPSHRTHQHPSGAVPDHTQASCPCA